MQRDISFTSENSWNSHDSIHVPRSNTIENGDDQASEASSTERVILFFFITILYKTSILQAEPSSHNLNENKSYSTNEEKKEIRPYNSKEPCFAEHEFPNNSNESFRLEINSIFESEHQVSITFGTTTYSMVATTNKIVVKRDIH